MTRNRVIALVVCLVIAALLYLALGPPNEPSYKGRTLSQWMNDVATVRPHARPRPTAQEWVEAVKHMGPKALPQLVRWLGDEPSFSQRTVSKIEAALPLPLRSPRLMLWLDQKAQDNEIRAELRASAAERALRYMGKDARPAVPALLGLFRSPGPGMGTYRAGEVLAALGKEALPEVLKCLGDPGFTNHLGLALVIGRMPALGEAGAPVVPFLCRGLRQGGPAQSQPCARALGDLGVAPEIAVPTLVGALTNALQNTDAILSRTCAEALGKFGPRAGQSVTVLCAALKSPDGITTEEAARALGKIGTNGDVAVPALMNYASSAGAIHRKHAIEGLAGYGAAARDAVPLLREALKDDDHDTRAAAEDALQKISPK